MDTYRFGPVLQSKAFWVESYFNIGSCLGSVHQIGLLSSTTLVFDKALDLEKMLDLDKVLNFWTVNLL